MFYDMLCYVMYCSVKLQCFVLICSVAFCNAICTYVSMYACKCECTRIYIYIYIYIYINIYYGCIKTADRQEGHTGRIIYFCGLPFNPDALYKPMPSTVAPTTAHVCIHSSRTTSDISLVEFCGDAASHRHTICRTIASALRRAYTAGEQRRCFAAEALQRFRRCHGQGLA